MASFALVHASFVLEIWEFDHTLASIENVKFALVKTSCHGTQCLTKSYTESKPDSCVSRSPDASSHKTLVPERSQMFALYAVSKLPTSETPDAPISTFRALISSEDSSLATTFSNPGWQVTKKRDMPFGTGARLKTVSSSWYASSPLLCPGAL